MIMQRLEAERNVCEAALEGSKKNTFTETVIIGRTFMAIDNLKNHCQSFNMALQKVKNRNIAQVAAVGKKNQPAGLVASAASGSILPSKLNPTGKSTKELKETIAGSMALESPEATHTNMGYAVGKGSQVAAPAKDDTIKSPKRRDEEHKGAEFAQMNDEDKIFNTKAARQKLVDVYHDMIDYWCILKGAGVGPEQLLAGDKDKRKK